MSSVLSDVTVANNSKSPCRPSRRKAEVSSSICDRKAEGWDLKRKCVPINYRTNDGLDTVEANEHLGYPADLRDYGIGAQILADLGVEKMRLLTNNPQKVKGLDGYGLEIVERVPLQSKPNPFNRAYLETKRSKLGHLLLDEE